ncbi:hypothetical protein C5E16_14085 [Clavibacter michiganensis]|uniref:Secreted protein n=1 Tax=Clavibacter michiganensis TaxID=28447 RepID=A0A2S5VNZ7_9MICO|nr:hypothetical protein [Clavibacter michiganensis]PPF64856.1 hypothetical protein C5E16_14085 [Clavibacter michiganensis]
MPRIHPRRKSSGVVVAALLISGALLATGTAPAHAAIAARYLDIQTRQTGAANDVRSVLISDGGSRSTCMSMVVGDGAEELLDDYVSKRLLVYGDQAYDAFSYSDDHCTDGYYLIGSKGSIHPWAAIRWSVYSGRPPRIAY